MATTLVTGGAGFIGSHLADLLLERGEQVLVIDDLSTGCEDNLPPSSVELTVADVREERRLDALVRRASRVMHLAAAVGVQRVADDPLDTLERNVEGTAAVLRACARWRRPVLIASSSEVYGASSPTPFREDQALQLGPVRGDSRWPYAGSKLIAEQYALAHARKHELPVAVARLFNTAGPRQSARHGMVIPRFVEQALRGAPLTVYGDGSQLRCFSHVRDVVNALVAMMETPAAQGCIVNLGSDRMVSISQLAGTIKALTGSASDIVHMPFETAYRPGFEDFPERRPDLARARALFGFEPRRDLNRILEEAIDHARTRLGVCRV